MAHKILAHLRLPTELEEPLPARLAPQLDLDLDLELGDDQAGLDELGESCPSPAALARPRSPD